MARWKLRAGAGFRDKVDVSKVVKKKNKIKSNFSEKITIDPASPNLCHPGRHLPSFSGPHLHISSIIMLDTQQECQNRGMPYTSTAEYQNILRVFTSFGPNAKKIIHCCIFFGSFLTNTVGYGLNESKSWRNEPKGSNTTHVRKFTSLIGQGSLGIHFLNCFSIGWN